MSALADPTTTSGGVVDFPVVGFRGSATELMMKDGNGFELFGLKGEIKLGVEILVFGFRFTVDW